MSEDAAAPKQRCLLITSDEAGESHFGDLELPLAGDSFAPPAPPLFTSGRVAAERVLFFHAPVGWFGDWHPTPARQFFIALSGDLEVHVSDGEVRHVRGGDIVLLEDLSGRGHTTRVVGDEAACAAVVQLGDAELPL
ncbi:MAG: cupin domain-containing protein [Dehalococcoidia bacterium]